MPLVTAVCPTCQKQFSHKPSQPKLCCSVSCSALAKTRSWETRLWSRIQKGSPDECWPWTGYRMSNGCGQINCGTAFRRKIQLTHRLAYALSSGVSVESITLCVCHECDNPPCCNPAHLFLGTQQDNMADMLAKGRYCKGVDNHNAKITEDEVREMRRLWKSGKMSQAAIGRMYGIAQGHARETILGIKWRHVA